MDAANASSRRRKIDAKLARISNRHIERAQEHLTDGKQAALGKSSCAAPEMNPHVPTLLDTWSCGLNTFQRSIIFRDTLRTRGTAFYERSRHEPKPMLHLDYAFVLKGRKFERPVNYALLKNAQPDTSAAGHTRSHPRDPHGEAHAQPHRRFAGMAMV
ncbi:hypothetical protein BURKHO8Y_10399 [Burkholderia sp. 8Y]|uniref:DUF3141 domain-containing protein n=1 Tax=Burkholderia sp. 8Y TaxID=2653133 RepID=UPI0012F3B018|nr:DUF3141 domain-containing protein [Burkholderia sp. 8Y]VXB08816.1 hypothetical protein BURKHO8Y_10399 [Burkholderia sp. 8Y]